MSETAAKSRAEVPTAEAVLAILRRHEPELRAAGVLSAAIFGSVARGEATAESDVDVLVRFEERPDVRGFAEIGRIVDTEQLLAHMLGRSVDLVTEPVQKLRLQAEIARDRLVVFS